MPFNFPACTYITALISDAFSIFHVIAFDELKTDSTNPIDQCNSLNPNDTSIDISIIQNLCSINLFFHWDSNQVVLVGHFESSLIIHTFVKQRLSILKMNTKGPILSSWHSTDGKVFGICDIEVIDDKLYFGSHYNTFLGVLNVPRGFS